jgi:hypothetical protein
VALPLSESESVNDSYVKYEVLKAVLLLGSDAMCTVQVITAM